MTTNPERSQHGAMRRQMILLNGSMLTVAIALFLLCLGGNCQTPSEHESSNGQSLVEMMATGVASDAGAAEKQALVSAVQQAVGIYLDNETMVKNEKLIYDKVLSASNGFVKEYKVIQAAHKRLSDGLYEVKILAKVQKGLVGAALRGAGFASVAVDGKNLWAEAVTRIKGQEDAEALLMDVLLKVSQQVMEVKVVDQKPEVIRDPETGRPKYIWYVDIKPRADWWYAEAVPALKAALKVIALKSKEETVAFNVSFPYRGYDYNKPLGNPSLLVYDAASGKLQWKQLPENAAYNGRVNYTLGEKPNFDLYNQPFAWGVWNGPGFPADLIFPIREPKSAKQITFIAHQLPRQLVPKVRALFPDSPDQGNRKTQCLQFQLESSTHEVLSESKMSGLFLLALQQENANQKALQLGGSFMIFGNGSRAHWVRVGYMVELPPEQYKEVAKFTVKWIPASNAESSEQ